MQEMSQHVQCCNWLVHGHHVTLQAHSQCLSIYKRMTSYNSSGDVKIQSHARQQHTVLPNTMSSSLLCIALWHPGLWCQNSCCLRKA